MEVLVLDQSHYFPSAVMRLGAKPYLVQEQLGFAALRRAGPAYSFID